MLLDVNPVACQMLGYSKNELLGLNTSQIIIEHENPPISSGKEAMHANARLPVKCQLRHKDGSMFTCGDLCDLDAGRQPFKADTRHRLLKTKLPRDSSTKPPIQSAYQS